MYKKFKKRIKMFVLKKREWNKKEKQKGLGKK